MSGTSSLFDSFVFPTIKRVAAQTVAIDLVPVQPIGGNSVEEMQRIEREIKELNREGKIESIITDKEFKEKKREDHPDYKKSDGPNGSLFYLDYNYGSGGTISGRGV